jgi:hypothetical protein
MTGKISAIPANKKHGNSFAFLWVAACQLLLLLCAANTCFADEEHDYDEVPIFISVPGVGSAEMPAIISRETIYLPVANLFDFLKIKNKLSPGLDSVQGFFINPQAIFLIDKKNKKIIYGTNVYELKDNDIIQTETNLYLRSGYFGQVFGLECTFNFRSLSVMLNTKLELPVIREMRQEAMRTNINQLKGESKTDTSLPRSKPLFHFGMADYSVITTQNTNGLYDTRLNLAIGTIIGGGETNVLLNYDTYTKFSERQQYYLWRMVDNDRHDVRQVMAGKIYTQSNASIYSPVVGFQFTNTPTTYRRSFGSYTLSDHTQPNWMVELYVNNVLVNYARADASGFFTFDVPLVYGNSIVKLRFYGPWGEERTSEQNINIPFNFLPQNQFEYTVSAGIVEDSLSSRFSRANFNYGMGKRITIGGGVEYLSSVSTGKMMPFVNASVRLTSNLLVSGEYIYDVRMKDILSYRLPSNLLLEMSYSRYKKGQKAINNTYLEERKAVVSYPFRSRKVSLFSRLTVYQIVLPASKYTTAEALLSGVVFGINANVTTYALFISEEYPYTYSNISSTLRLPAKLLFTPQLQYGYNERKVISLKGELGKPLSSHGYANIYYENNYKTHFQSIGIGFRYDFSFGQLSFSARRGDHNTTTTQTARGSLIYDDATGYFSFSNRTSVGKAGIAIVPYLDLNCNGKRDKNEPKVSGLKIQTSTGCIKYINSDTTIQITDLEAYTSYIIKLNTDGFDNITWRLKKKVLNVGVGPNQLRLVEVPVCVEGEVSGTVYVSAGAGRKGLGRMIVSIYNSESKQVAHTLTEEDGFFSYLGLPPGSYTARIDAAQLNKLHFASAPESIPFTIRMSKDGDVVDGLEFLLQALPGNAASMAEAMLD